MNNKIYLADLTHTGSGLMALTFPLGTSYVAGYSNKVLSDEFDFKLFKLPEDLIKAISKESPLVLALSNYSWNIELGYKVIEWAKDLNPNLITVFGGPNFPTDSSEKQDFLKFRSMVDFYIESEGEVGFVDLLRKLKEYDFNFKALKRAQEKIINCTYLGENCLIEATIQRITDVNMLPSPYLNGSMDEFFKLPLIPMIETNRGCPFSCTFCADGLKYKNKVYSYDTSRVREELHYIYENVKNNGFKMDELRISDLNFGMFREDKETAGYIAELQSNYGWPKLVRGSLGKNRHDRIMDMLGLLKGTFPMGAALQSTDETVLKNIKRSNISVESYKKVMRFMNETDKDKNSKTFSELILGLPGDSKKIHFQSLKTVIENKVNTIRQFQAILLSGTEMANAQTRDEFKLLTKHRIMTGAVGKYKFGDDEVPITEIEEIIVGSKDMSFDDYVTCRKMLLIIETFHNNALFEEFFLALEKLGISEWECLVYILNHDEIYTSKVKEIMLSYVKSTKYGLYETYEQAKTHSIRPGRYEKHLSGEIGSRELVEHKGLLYNEMGDLVKIMVKVSKKFMEKYGVSSKKTVDYFEQLGYYIICAKGNIVDTDLEYGWEFNYHWTDIGKLNFEIDPRKIKRYNENLSFKFIHNKDQKNRIKNAIALHPNHPTAAPMLYNQNMKMLYRVPKNV